MFLRRVGRAVLLVAAALLVLVPAAAADQSYHSDHVAVWPVASAPLLSGFVENIHADGPNVYAIEIYQLNGASANTTYYVSTNIYMGGCEDGARLITSLEDTSLTTDAAGNGSASETFPLELIDQAGLHDMTLGGQWTFATGTYADQGGTVVYESECTTVPMD